MLALLALPGEIRMRETDPDQLPVLDDEIVTELREIMEDEFTNLLQTFLGDLPLQLERLQAAFDQGDADTIFTIAHKLKSSCGSLGALRLMELTRQIEQAGREKNLDGVAELLDKAWVTTNKTITALQAQIHD